MTEQRDQSNVEPERRGFMCVVQWVIDGTTLYAIPFIWNETTRERAARAASHMELPPNHKRYRITVVPLEDAESFRWTGQGEVQSEQVG